MRGVDPEVAKRLVQIDEQGTMVESDVLGVVAKIQAYDPNLRVQFCDPTRATLADAPYRIMELCPDGQLRHVMSIMELDERVMERLYAADTYSTDVLADIELANRRARDNIRRRFRDEMEALTEMAAAVLRSPKDTYRATNPVTGQVHVFSSQRRG